VKPGNKHDAPSCRGTASVEYVILTALITAAVIGALVHLELQVPRLFRNAATALEQAVPDGGPGKDGSNGGSGSLENEPPPIPDRDRAR
jgi:Flp pilus assembly pilin Flp